MQWLTGYDIHQPRRRRKACTVLRSASSGYQDSTFECSSQPTSLLQQLQGCLNEHDYFYIARHPGHGPDWQIGCNNTAATDNELILFL
jgi:hypothetical protein